ncbi:DUF551 domain-containing protein [Escherichia coli]
MTTITDKKQYPGEQYLNELITNIEFAARAPVEVVRAMAAELQKRREADSAEPVSQTYNLPELIEGMEVSIDVSTCDADLGNRYFGTVTEASELDTAKNGYILLVQDAEPNFDVNGNSPVTPDGWISCSERTPESIPGSCKEYLVFDALNNKVHHDYWVVPDGDSAPVASFWNHYGAHVTHWMPLPEPPQEAK